MDKPIIVDSHHHFWAPARADYPWMTDELAAIRRPFGLAGDALHSLPTLAQDKIFGANAIRFYRLNV